ncbi:MULTISPECIES: sugar ABC transporter permease [unclassified Paenibacillus]|uniref:carbohydrate ABC transporter permease n=1 Tax=unclassified Paenibacillus TaxID=185978 RepID=UPI002406E7F2|nr:MULTISPECIES: sugar ABC transporter permease [unclassified Paenibacillus]MDF9839937.1 ABC-type sugar transport system permease subunit [Paenibacillus sp. PastF-2]MDF9846519.1 ABC-type sugar transport system permease subunit [Paenibacillus sp. PastM-2]MDF9853133.1 ABC-type sugar transport system permease subunit [Paenibacillus sp. PastF-1]MDH6478363.1 ABC-type sugar transport system permease subunit [Paenibacillus sp. PastH-2]MDH6506139.1 ABC-type sugar transport system permease subunit [Pae
MHETKRQINAWTFVAPSLLLTLIFGVYPIFWALKYMFYDYQGFGTPLFIGLDNFERLFRDKDFWHSVVNTFIYAGGKLIITIPLSFILAVILNRALKGRQLLRAIYFLPTVISASVMAIVFYVIFNSYNGMVNQLLMGAGIVSAPIDWLGAKYALLTAIIIAIWGAVGNYMLLFIAGLQNIPEDLYEAASIDGAGPLRKMWSITVPMLGPVLQMIIMLAITVSLKGYESIMVLTEGGPYGKTEVMYLYLYKLFFPVSSGGSSIQQFGYGSAVGFTTAVIVGLITLIYFYVSKKLNDIY